MRWTGAVCCCYSSKMYKKAFLHNVYTHCDCEDSHTNCFLKVPFLFLFEQISVLVGPFTFSIFFFQISDFVLEGRGGGGGGDSLLAVYESFLSLQLKSDESKYTSNSFCEWTDLNIVWAVFRPLHSLSSFYEGSSLFQIFLKGCLVIFSMLLLLLWND